MSLVLDNVSKHVGGHVHIENVSLTLEHGSLNVLLGPTLSGKTSLMRLMAGLDAPSAGRVLVDGKDVTGVHVRKRSVAMVYQQFINYPSLTVYENIASPLRVAKRPKAEIDQKVREAARLLKLDKYLDRTPMHLSGGQQQRTAIARALVKDAQLVLLDEPLASLDRARKGEILPYLVRLRDEAHVPIVYVSHNPEEIRQLASEVVRIEQGRVAGIGGLEQLDAAPAG